MKFSNTWKSSTKPRKQRNYRAKAPLHLRGSFLNAHLSKELSQKHGKRAVRLRKGDKVKIMSGQFKSKTGKIESVNMKTGKVFVEGIESQKPDGTKVRYPISPSNLMITELDLSDKKRQEALKRK